ncbi:MAG: signal-transduction protein with cAMP-binding, CBS, and nucleotidyltransferase domain [Chlamydiales bacterium]|jgi:signal-transduction protein with cAMP-binding, CBS, and nucleotidyltransferase domain
MKTFRDIPVEELMMREVRTVLPTSLLTSAAQTMRDENITCLIVDLKDPARGLGIITQKDMIGYLFDEAISLESTMVEDAMTSPTITLAPEWSLETAVSVMSMVGVRRAPVVKDGKLVGLLSYTDVFRYILSSSSED